MKPFKEFIVESTSIPFVFCGIGKHDVLNEWAWENSYDTLDELRGRHAKKIMDNHEAIRDHFRENTLFPLHNRLIDHYRPYTYSLSRDHNHSVINYIDGSKGLNSLLVRYHHQGLDLDNPTDYQTAQEYDQRYHPVHTSYLRVESIFNHDGFKKRLNDLDSVLDNAPESPDEYHVYTGVGDRFDIDKLRKAGHSIIHLPAYTSTSINPKLAGIFAKQKYGSMGHTDESEELMPEMVRFRIPKGSTSGLYLPQNSSEKEFLMKRGTNIRLLGKPRYTIFSGVGAPKHIKIHDAEIV